MQVHEQQVLLTVLISKSTVNGGKYATKARQAADNLSSLNIIGIDVTTTVINPLSQMYTSNVFAC